MADQLPSVSITTALAGPEPYSRKIWCCKYPPICQSVCRENLKFGRKTFFFSAFAECIWNVLLLVAHYMTVNRKCHFVICCYLPIWSDPLSRATPELLTWSERVQSYIRSCWISRGQSRGTWVLIVVYSISINHLIIAIFALNKHLNKATWGFEAWVFSSDWWKWGEGFYSLWL
jgi:hypothetical protein